MDTSLLQIWIKNNPETAFAGIVVLSVAVFLVTRAVIGRGLVYLAKRTKTQYDDIIVEKLRPFRVAWLAPLVLLYLFAYLVPGIQTAVEDITLFLILWVLIATVNSLFNGVNQIYESSPAYSGVSIQGYLDVLKIILLAVGVILSVSLFTGESPLVLLSGLGALTAVLLLVFRDTILSLVASVQIAANDLVKEGDWLEVPSYTADGDVINITLHNIKVQNWDKTISVIPTYKMMDVAFKNWRGMQESGGRRIKRSIYLNLSSVKFCDAESIARYKQLDLLKDFFMDQNGKPGGSKSSTGLQPAEAINSRQLTNLGVFRAYIDAFLRQDDRLHKDNMTLLVRQLEPGSQGIPLEIYVFTKTTNWEIYENIQAEIIEHLIAAAAYFDLGIFQLPTGMDVSALANR